MKKHLITTKTFLRATAILHPADVTGTWKSDFDTQIGHQKYTYTLKQDART